MASPTRDLPPLLLPAALGFGGYGLFVLLDRRTGTLRAESTATSVVIYLLAFAVFLFAVVIAERSADDAKPADGHRPLRPLRLLWLAPIGFRLLMLATEPTLSDDVYRYLWDGHVLSNGVNPYRYAMSAPELDHLAIPVRELANNPDLSSPYLPTTQVLFALLSFVLPSKPIVMQIVMVGFDLAAALVIRSLLRSADLPPQRVMLYLWNPLVIIEAAHGAHFDPLMTFLALLAVLAAVRPFPWFVSPVLLALAALTRPIPLLLTPVLWWRWTWRQRLTFGATLLLAVLPFGFGAGGLGLLGRPTGTGVFGSARVYTTEFRFNALVADWIEQLVRGVEAFTIATGLLTAVALGIVGLLARARWREPAGAGVDVGISVDSDVGPDTDTVRGLLRLSIIPLVVYGLLTPVFHPWYLVTIIAFGLFLAPGREESVGRWFLFAPLCYFNGAVFLSYLTYRDPARFVELEWVRRVEWYPTLLFGALVAIASVVAARRRPVHF